MCPKIQDYINDKTKKIIVKKIKRLQPLLTETSTELKECYSKKKTTIENNLIITRLLFLSLIIPLGFAILSWTGLGQMEPSNVDNYHKYYYYWLIKMIPMPSTSVLWFILFANKTLMR